MTFEFFEGAAGTGKTHSLVERAARLVEEGVLEEERRLLALTFMNGSRRRLEARLTENPTFRRRFACQTFDVFARTVSSRRISMLTPELKHEAEALGEFDGPCFLAAKLLGHEPVRQWVARTYPLILVDEAQDLDPHRLQILKELSEACRILAAADGFQCLHDGRDTTDLISWLENAGETTRLTKPRRTNQQGLLDAALAVREARNIKDVLTERSFQNRTSWTGTGFRLLEAPATQANSGLLAWNISNEFSRRQGNCAVLTPDGNNRIIHSALETVRTRSYKRKKDNKDFGPYPIEWERHDTASAEELLDGVEIPEMASFEDFTLILAPLRAHPCISQTIGRLDRLRRTTGQVEFQKPDVESFVRDAVRNQARLGYRKENKRTAMTIQRAKNREFQNVIFLWPHTATGSEEHLRRILYNGITRAMSHCTMIVLGQGRSNQTPFR